MGIFDQLHKSLVEDDCVRHPLIHSIGAGTTLGLVHFVFSGLVQRSIYLGLFLIWPVSIGSALYCRYNEKMNQLKSVQFRDALRYQALTQGTDKDVYSKKRQE